MSSVDVIILIAFIAYAVCAGFRNRRQASKNLEEYFLAGRSLPGWKAGLSMAATQFAADTPLLVTGIIATAGIFGLWQFWIFGITFLLLGFVLAGAWRRAGVVTDAELTEVRYGGTPAAVLRGVKAFYFGTVINGISLAWVLFAAAKIAEPFLLWDQWLPGALFQSVVNMVDAVGVPLTVGGIGDPEVWVKTASNFLSLLMILGVVAFYSATGGLRGVVATDIVQIAIMALGTFAFAVTVVWEVGGLGSMTERIYETFTFGGPGGILPGEILAFTPGHGKDATLTVLSLLGLLWLINSVSDGSGYLAQRTMACRSDRDAKTAAVVFTFTQVLVRSLLWLPLGIGLLVLFPPELGLAPELVQADREATYVRGMAELLPPGVTGLMLTGMLAALASNRVPAEVTMMAALVAVLVGDVITVEQALAGFANPGLMTVAVLYVVAAALRDTGAIFWVAHKLLGQPKSALGSQARLILPTSILSAFLNNTTVVAMMIPAVQEWAQRLKLSASQLLLPLSYAAILGGTTTLIGRSSTLVGPIFARPTKNSTSFGRACRSMKFFTCPFALPSASVPVIVPAE